MPIRATPAQYLGGQLAQSIIIAYRAEQAAKLHEFFMRWLAYFLSSDDVHAMAGEAHGARSKAEEKLKVPPTRGNRPEASHPEELAPDATQNFTPLYPPLQVRAGVLVVDGFGIALRVVSRGKLRVEDGIGRQRRSLTSIAQAAASNAWC